MQTSLCFRDNHKKAQHSLHCFLILTISFLALPSHNTSENWWASLSAHHLSHCLQIQHKIRRKGAGCVAAHHAVTLCTGHRAIYSLPAVPRISDYILTRLHLSRRHKWFDPIKLLLETWTLPSKTITLANQSVTLFSIPSPNIFQETKKLHAGWQRSCVLMNCISPHCSFCPSGRH